MSSDSEESHGSAHEEDVIGEHMDTAGSSSPVDVLASEDLNQDGHNATRQSGSELQLEEQ